MKERIGATGEDVRALNLWPALRAFHSFLICIFVGFSLPASAMAVPPQAMEIAVDMTRAWFTEPPTPADSIRVENHEIQEIPLDFPPVFRVRMRSDTGAVEFFDEDTDALLCSVGGSADFNPWLIADLRGAAHEFMWLPSRVERIYSLASPVPMTMGLSGCSEEILLPTTSLVFTAIYVLSNGVSFGTAWPTNETLPEAGLDLFATSSLVQGVWTWMARFDVGSTTNEASLTLDSETAFTEALPLLDEMLVPAQQVFVGWNVHVNPPIPSGLESFFPEDYISGALVSNAIYEAATAPSAFFRLGTLLDSNTNGLSDAYELLVYGTDPNDPDTDGDGLANDAELALGLNPLVADTDGDGLSDFDELLLSTNSLDPDTDGDSMPDGWEVQYGLEPDTYNNPEADSDGDALTDGEESALGTNPFRSDTDGDGVPDSFDSAPCDAENSVVSDDSISVAVMLKIGDTSGSFSELYAISLNGITLRMPSVNAASHLYSLTIRLDRGATYEGYVESLPDDDDDGDFDAYVIGSGISVNALPETLGGHFENTGFNSGRRSFSVTVPSTGQGELPDASSQAASPDPTLAEKGDPVNAMNGNVRASETDIAIEAPGIPIVFTRHYNSASLFSFGGGRLGPGWAHGFTTHLGQEESLVFDGNAGTYRRIFFPDGGILAFRKRDNGFFPARGAKDSLSYNGSVWSLVDTLGAGYSFDVSGRMLARFDGLGNSISLSYDADGRLSTMTHVNGQGITLEYGIIHGQPQRGEFLLAAYPTSVDWHIEYDYDASGRLSAVHRVTQTETFSRTYTYENTGFALTSRYDAQSNHAWHYTFEDLARGGITRRACVCAWNQVAGSPDEMETYFDYAPTGFDHATRVTSIRAPNDETTSLLFYDPPTSLVVSEVNEADGSGFEIERDTALNPVRETVFENERSASHWQTFDARGNVLTEALALGSAQPASTNQIVWHETLDLPVMTIDAVGGTNFFAWSDVGLLLCASNALGGSVSFAYTTNGLPLEVTTALGGITSFGYDTNGLLSSVSTPDGLWFAVIRSAHGHLESLVLPGLGGENRVIGFQNDTFGRRVGLSGDWEGLFEPITRDAAGRITSLDDDFGYYPAKIGYGRGNQVATVSRMLDSQTDAVVSFAHDRQWNLRSVSDELGRTVESYALDVQGRVASVTNLEKQVTSVGYLIGGAVTSMRCPISLLYSPSLRFGVSITNEYDSTGDLTSNTVLEIAPGSRSDSVQLTWRPDNQPLSAQSTQGSVSWAYDAVGSATSETARVVVSGSSSITSAVHWAISPAGQTTNTALLTANGDWQVAYAHDTAGRVTNIVSPAGSFAVEYNAWNGRISSVSNAVLATRYDYDGQERLVQIDYAGVGGAALGWFTYGYGGSSSKLSFKQAWFPGHLIRYASYQYDALGRLYSGNGVPGINTYDLAGNRTRNGTQTWTYSADTSHITGIPYDSPGNVQRTWHGSDNIVPYFDIRGRIGSISSNAVYVVGAAHDALGRRIRSTERGVTTYHVYDGDHVVADVDASGEVRRFYTWGLGVDNLLAVTVCSATATNSYYAVKDHLNSVYGFVNSSGTIIAMYDYGAWGNLKSKVVSTPDLENNRYLWNGREYSYATGLYYFRARWYDPVTARWLSKDPIGINGGINLYVYCGNDPVNFRDPHGLKVAWGQVGRGGIGLVVNGVGAVAGAVFAETGAGAVVAVYCSYGVGANVGNIINGFRGTPAGPTGPASALSQGTMLAVGVNSDSSTYRNVDYGAQATDLAVPLIASGGLDWRLVTRPAGAPGTLAGALTRVVEDPRTASLAARLAVGADAAITAGEGIGSAIGETKKKKCP